MANKFFMPKLSLIGIDSLEDAGTEIKNLGFKKALIVTDNNMVQTGLTVYVTELLDKIGVEYIIYDKVQPNPTIKNVEDGIDIFKINNCDFAISFGGGSSHDCAKGICLVVTNGGSIADYEGVDQSKFAQAPLIAINTTAGTASEMTVFTIITDENSHIKMAIVDKNVLPIFSVNDPKIMISMPKGLTAATGMDALTHSIEAYVSTAATPITDACAQKAIELIAESLKTAVDQPTDLNARSNMSYAQYLAGMAFSNASLGYVHAMAHQLGGFYDLPHGVCNAILLPHVCAFNAQKVAKKFKDIAGFLGQDTRGLSDEAGAQLCIDTIIALSKAVDIPEGLSTLGVQAKDLETLSKNAMKDACGFTNPIQPSLDEVIALYKQAM